MTVALLSSPKATYAQAFYIWRVEISWLSKTQSKTIYSLCTPQMAVGLKFIKKRHDCFPL